MKLGGKCGGKGELKSKLGNIINTYWKYTKIFNEQISYYLK